MPRQKKVDATEPAQPPLVPLSDDEVDEHQRTLPKLIGELADLKTMHQGRRAEMKKERSELQERINNIAQQLRDQGR